MVTKKKKDSTHLSILDAVETLSRIVDLEFQREVEVATKDEINEQNQMVTARTVQWLESEDPDSTVKLIRGTFHVVLDYLRDFYRHEYRHIGQPQVVEGVKTIMVLVGEAANKLDKYTTLFQRTKSKSATALKEYKQLQEFYLTRIARKIDQGVLGRWILELTKGAMKRREEVTKLKGKKPIQTEHVFIDLESVKRDTEYELFYLKKEDGTRFFNPRLIRNIKLVCDFGESIEGGKESDLLSKINIWQDHMMQVAAKNILQTQGVLLDRFFGEAKKFWKRELVAALNKAVIALMMSSNPRNLLRNSPVKSCLEYFVDFQFFLRTALKSREYQRLMVYPPKRSNRLAHCLLDLTHSLCRALFSSIRGYQELISVFENVLHKAEQAQSPEHSKAAAECNMLWSRLAADYSAMKKLIRKHPNGPLVKDLEILQQGVYHVFDPIAHFNIPNQLYSLYLQEHKMTNIRIPTPTYQEFIHKAEVLEEFKGFLRAYSRPQFKRKHLLINLQDRTSWKEHSRSVALEDLQKNRNLAKSLTVVTLAKDTEFYHQLAPYHEDNHANIFIKHFKEHLSDENCGFYFPKLIFNNLFPEFVDGVIDTIHRIFFSNRNVLPKGNRLDFIEIFYLFLELKLIELTTPDTFSLACKDGIDKGGVASTQLYAFLKILNDEELNVSDFDHINFMLYTAPLLIRERIIQAEPFDRMINVLKRIEEAKEELGNVNFEKIIKEAFGRFYKTPILNAMVVIPTL